MTSWANGIDVSQAWLIHRDALWAGSSLLSYQFITVFWKSAIQDVDTTKIPFWSTLILTSKVDHLYCYYHPLRGEKELNLCSALLGSIVSLLKAQSSSVEWNTLVLTQLLPLSVHLHPVVEARMTNHCSTFPILALEVLCPRKLLNPQQTEWEIVSGWIGSGAGVSQLAVFRTTAYFQWLGPASKSLLFFPFW